MEKRQTIITLKNICLSYREFANKVNVSVITVSFMFNKHLETGGNSSPF